MADPNGRIAQLHIEHNYWEGVRVKAQFELAAQREEDAKEEAKSRLATAGFNLDQINQELNRLQGKQEHEMDPADEKPKDDKEFFEKQEKEKQEFAAKQAQEQKDFAEQQERDREAFASRQENERQWHEASEITKGATIAGAALKVIDVALDVKEMMGQVVEGVVPTALFSEMNYIKDQAIEAFAEAANEIGIAIGNPVNQKEAGKFLEEKSQGLKDFMADEMFQAAPAEKKIEWLEHKFGELQREEEKKFGERDNSLGIREIVHDGLDEMKEKLLDAAKQEKVIQDKVNEEVALQKKTAQDTIERLEKNGAGDDKIEQVRENQRKMEEQARQKAESESKAIWDRAQQEMEKAKAQARDDASRQDAERRKKADNDMKEMYHLR